MQGTPGDNKNIELAKLLHSLRQNIDLYRIIGLNVDGLQKKGVSNAFWAYIQRLAHEGIALTICKIYKEPTPRYELNSILGVITSLPENFTVEQTRAASEFGRTVDMLSEAVSGRAELLGIVELFRERMKNELLVLKHFRDKMGAHSEAGAKVEHLASIDSHEKFFDFADRFYRLVAGSFVGVHPALIGTQVGTGTVRVMAALGVNNPRFDFSQNDDAPPTA